MGDIGFKGRASTAGTVEIGFGIVPSARGRGYATEAGRSLVAWAFEHGEVDAVVAECERDNEASAAVLRKLGMSVTTESGSLLLWQLDRPGVTAAM